MKLESFLRWLAIVLFTALAVWVTIPTLAMINSPTLRRINPFYWYLAADVVLWFIVIRFVLQEFYMRGQLFGGVKQFYERVLEHPLHRLYKLFFRNPQTLTSRLTITALSILSITTLIATRGALDNFSLMIARAYERKIPEIFRPRAHGAPGNYAGVLQITTTDNNSGRYLDACLTTVQELKTAGARVVMMELPWLPNTEENLQKVEAINKTGIVVFGTRFSGFDPQFKGWRYTQNPLLGRLDLSWGQYTFPEKISYMYPSVLKLFLNPFIPYSSVDVRTREIVPDVGIEALRKYVGASKIQNEGNEVLVGDIRLPVTNDGVLLSHHIFGAFPIHTFSMSARVDEKTSSATYMAYKEKGSMIVSKNLKEFVDVFRDKIVILRWDEHDNPKTQGWSEAIAYTTLINNALGGKNLIRKSESGPLYLTLLCVLLCAFISRYLRGLYAVPLMLLLSLVLLFGSLWLLYNQNILLDVSYPLVAVILSIAGFPLARFAWTMRAILPTVPLVPEPVTAQPATGGTWFAFTGKRLSLSLPLAAIVLLTAIGGSVLLTSLLQKPEIQKEPIYIMSMPTVEVQDYYSPSNGAAQ